MEKDFNLYIAESKSRIIQVLDSFKIGHGEVNAIPGPTVTLFEFKPSIGVRLSKIRNLKDEFTIALDANSVRVIAPIPERGTVGIEVPNKVRQNVPIMDMLYSEEYLNTDYELPLVLGRKVDNSVFTADLAKMPHLLVAGATGMGKSVGLNVIIASLLNRLSPEELKLVLVDPKQVELSIYDTIAKPYLAHLEGLPAISTTPEEAKATLEAVIRLMEKRYDLLSGAGVRNIQDYNGMSGHESLPYYVVIIDEYGDLILSANDREMEKLICRIAQKARAVGIHMIISTQRPDTKIVTGSIKANFPTRIAFRTTTGTDSRVVLDRMGAERLTGRGDMLYFDGSPENVRCQCAYISTEQVTEMCSELATEYADAEETLLPSPPVTGSSKKYITLFKCIFEETRRYLPDIVKLNYLKEKGVIALANMDGYLMGLRRAMDVISQLREVGIVGDYIDWEHGNPVLIHDEQVALKMLEDYYA